MRPSAASPSPWSKPSILLCRQPYNSGLPGEGWLPGLAAPLDLPTAYWIKALTVPGKECSLSPFPSLGLEWLELVPVLERAPATKDEYPCESTVPLTRSLRST